jgi:hypothetical protein
LERHQLDDLLGVCAMSGVKVWSIVITSSMAEEEGDPPQVELCATKDVAIRKAEDIVKQFCQEEDWDWEDHEWRWNEETSGQLFCGDSRNPRVDGEWATIYVDARTVQS